MKNEIQNEALKLDHQMCFPLYAAGRKIVSQYNPFLKPLGITYTQYIVFLVLWEQDGISVGELGKKLMLDSGTLTPMLKKMESEGSIKRIRSLGDERIVEVHLTLAGAKLKEKAKDIPARMSKCIGLPMEDAMQLYQLLHKLLKLI